MKKLTQGATRLLVLALGLGLTATGWADFAKTNPVTGETENYTWKFVGTDMWNGTQYWQDSTAANPSAVPAKSESNIWAPILFDGSAININAGMRVEGWALRMGLFNGARITLNNLRKLQNSGSDMWITVDSSSKFAVGSTGFKESDSEAKGGAIGENGVNINFYVASENGIDFQDSFDTISDQGATVNYYLTGAGSVQYAAISAANHKIKQADVTLSNVTASKMVRSRTLVSFTSSTKTFTADATIKVKNSDGTANRDVALSSVTATTSTLTTSGNVGDCELVQTSTGILLYYVDYAKTYKPSININFTSGTALSTASDVGLGDYAIPGTSWNNLAGSNGSLSALNAADSSGATFATAASVTISGARGSYSCSSLTAASDLRHGYIDESTSGLTPTITVSGIPYEKYRVIVYTATDAASKTFGYLTITGKNYTYVNSALTEGTTAWGASGGQNTAEPMAEGVNVLVSPVTLGSTLTVVGHRNGNDTRGCIAAVQIVEYVPEITENDLVIPVMNATTHTVSEAKTLSGTVYVVGSGTLTLDGSAKITAATIDVAKDVVLNVNADRLDATTFVGYGTVVYNGSQPVAGKGWADADNWVGTVWVKNVGSSGSLAALGHEADNTNTNPVNGWGNANSFVKFTNVYGYMSGANCPWTLILEDDGDNKAWYNNNGWSGRQITIGGLKGSGTFYDASNKKCRQNLVFTDATAFTGSIHVEGKRIGLGGTPTVSGDSETLAGVIEVVTGATATLASGQTWNAGYRIAVNGTLTDNGTMESGNASAAISGSGTVVFGGVPSPTGDKWWKNAAWTGTVEIKGATALNGDYAFNDYGNSGSTLKLTNCTGWLKNNYTCVPALEIGGTFTWNDGASGLNNTFKVATLKGSGTISIPNQGADTAVWQITDNWSGFTGPVIGNNSGAKRVLVFGPTLPASITKGVIYISEGATLNLDNSSSAWWGVGMRFIVDGTVKASARNKWGGGTGMVLGDTGVLEFLSTSNTDDQNTEMGNITGTGTLKFSSTAGWRSYPKTDANMPATTLTIQTELVDSLILPTKNDGETVVGNIAGSKNIRSDWSDNGANGRILTVTQSKDTEWQGKFVSNRTTQFNVVAPAEGTPGTLTLSGTQEATIPMQVDGSVNLTGTWKGNTTVSGTFGGTGTLTGNLTFSDGATFKAFATDADGLSVSGTVTCPAEGTVTVDVSDLTLTADVALLTASNLNKDKFTLTGAPENSTLEVVEGVLTLKLPVTITVPAVANTTVTVTAGGEPVVGENGVYTVPYGSAVVVTYAAEAGYVLSGETTYNIASATENTTITPDTVAHAPVAITVPTVEHTTVTVTAGDAPVVGVNGVYTVPYGSAVVVTYAAATGYELSGTATYNIASATTDTSITITDTVANPYVAQVMGGASYTTLAEAIANATIPMVTLLADVSEPEITVSSIVAVGGSHTINADMKIADGGALQLAGPTLVGKLTIEGGGKYVTSGGTLSKLVAKDGSSIELSTLSETTAPLSVTELTVEGKFNVRLGVLSAARGTTYKAISYVTANATIDQAAEITGVDEWSASVVTEGANTVVCLEMTAVALVNGVYYDVAQDAVDAAVLSGNPVSFLVAPGTVTIGLNETLIVSGAIQPTVAMEDSLTNPPYDVAWSIDENTRYIYTIERYVAKLKNPDYGKTAWLSEVKYTTLAAAVADVIVNNQVGYDAGYVPLVTLLDDVSLDAIVTVDKRMNLNLNGKTLTANGFAAVNNSTMLAIQGSGSVTATSGDSVVLTTSGATVTVSAGATLSPTPTTTVANSYVKLVGSTYSVDAYNTVTFTAPNATVTRTDGLGDAIKDGDTITFTVAPAAGYHVTGVAADSGEVSGNGPYTYTVTGDAAITVSTALDSTATVGAATFTYGADFASATVSVAVTEVNTQNTQYTLTVNGKNYTSTASEGSVVFTGVEIPQRNNAYESVSYTITSDATTTAGVTSGNKVIADEKVWINENATTHVGGVWAETVTYDNSVATLEDNTFTPTNSTGDRVTVTIDKIVYPALSDLTTTISPGAQGAIAISTNGTETVTTNFYVLATNNVGDLIWNATAQAAAVGTEYNIEFTFDYAAKKYSVKVGGTPLTVGGNSTFDLCADKTQVAEIDFLGAGTLQGITGIDSLGYMVRDAKGTFYATVQAAIQAFDKANGPYVLLRAGTPTDDCKFITEGGVTILKKLVKGMFFLAL